MPGISADPEEKLGAKNSISSKNDLFSFCTNVTICCFLQASFFQDAAENGLMQSYSSQTSSLVYQMVQQLHNYVKDNEDLKKTVRYLTIASICFISSCNVF